MANVTIAEATTLLDGSNAQSETEAPTNHTASSFAPEPMTITQPAYSSMAIGHDPGSALGGVPRSGYADSQATNN